MNAVTIVSLIWAGISTIGAVVLWRLLVRARARSASLEGSSQRPAPARPEPAPAAKAPPALKVDNAVKKHAARMIQNAHEMVRYLGIEHLAEPGVYRISLELPQDMDLQAARFIQDRPFDCVRSLELKGRRAVVLIDHQKRPPV